MDNLAVSVFLSKNYIGQEEGKTVHIHSYLAPWFKKKFPAVVFCENMFCPRDKIYILDKSQFESPLRPPGMKPPICTDWLN